MRSCIKSVGISCTASSRSFSGNAQYNPLHDFSSRKGNIPAHSREDFTSLILNPSSMSVSFSSDYLDWYYSAYKNKIASDKEHDARVEKEELSTMETAISTIPGMNGKMLKAHWSHARRAATGDRCSAQQNISNSAIAHGLMDVFERKSQFPAIHIPLADDVRVREIFSDMILPHCVSSEEVWDKALLYRAMLNERRLSYPDSFKYILSAVDAVVFSSEESKAIFPSEQSYDYFVYLVRKYNIENATEASVVLRCHRHTDCEKLLFSHPPPRAEAESLRKPVPQEYPPIEALFQSGNEHLIRCFLFAEFNCMISASPFQKFPDAAAEVMRSHVASTTVSSPSSLVTQRRGPLLPALPPNICNMLDGRARDVDRLRRAHLSSDSTFGRDLARLRDQEPAQFALDSQTYNPRTLRGELRSAVTKEMLSAVRKFEVSQEDMHRCTMEHAETERLSASNVDIFSHHSPMSTVAYFTNLLLRDSHVSLCCALGGSSTDRLKELIVSTAEAMFAFSRDYLTEGNRRIQKEKLKIFSKMLDDCVDKCISDLQVDSSASELIRTAGTRKPISTRSFEADGSISIAKKSDYDRWMSLS